LCDYAQVREGLLFILSGGVTRIHRDSFPAPLGVCVALVVELDRIEAERAHHLELVVVGEDGEGVARMDADVQVATPEAAKPGESLQMPLVVDLHGAPVPKAGAYELRVYIDGEHRRMLQFWAEPVQAELQL
jgi:hypothetical protein